MRHDWAFADGYYGRRLQLEVNITGASKLSIEEPSDPMRARGLPASRTDKLNNEALANAFPLQPEVDATTYLHPDQIELVQRSKLSHLFTDLDNSLTTSANCTPFTPLDIAPVHAWSLDPKSGHAGMVQDLDDYETQYLERVKFIEAFDFPF